MAEIRTVKQLYNALRLQGKTEVGELEKEFDTIARALLNRFVIKKGGKTYRLVEIEFYHNRTDEAKKKTTYKRIADSCDFFFHPSGVDLCFESSESSFGGILIRSVQCNGESINGPGKVADTLFDKFSAIRRPKDFPRIKALRLEDDIVPVSSPRWKIGNEKPYRYYWPQTLWNPDPKEYLASPWAIKQNDNNQ